MKSGLAMRVYLSNSAASTPGLIDEVRHALTVAGHSWVTGNVTNQTSSMQYADMLLVIPPEEHDPLWWEISVGKGQALAITDWYKAKGTYDNVFILNSCRGDKLLASQLLSTSEVYDGDWKTDYLELTTDFGDKDDNGVAYNGKTIHHIANIVAKRNKKTGTLDKETVLRQTAQNSAYLRANQIMGTQYTHVDGKPINQDNTQSSGGYSWQSIPTQTIPSTPKGTRAVEITGLTEVPMLALRGR